MANIQVEIVSAEKAIFSGEASMVFAPASEGEVGIAPGHTPMVTGLIPGEVRVQTEEGEEQGFFVTGGLMEVQPGVVTILSDAAEHSSDLEEAAVLKAKEEAEKAFHDATGEIDYAHVQQQLAEASARYYALQRLKRRRN